MPPDSAVFASIVSAVRDQTALLLGTTIGFSEEDWAAPTALAGWTRSHIAAHLAQGADAMTQLIGNLLAGHPARLYPSDAEKRLRIELGALATGLELQIGLDTSAGHLQDALPALEGDNRDVCLHPGRQIAAHELPLARLSEITLHHLDLGGPGPGVLPPEVAVELLRFEASLMSSQVAGVWLVADEGFEIFIGSQKAQAQVSGPAGDLVAWLMRSKDSPALHHSSPG